MSLNRKLAHNTLYQFAGKGVGTLLALVAATALFRYLGPVQYGKFHIILTFVQLAGIMADMGLYLIVLQDISHPPAGHRHIISQNFVFRFYLNLIYLAGMGLLALILSYEPVIKWGIFLMSFSNSFIWFGQILQTIFQKRLITQYIAFAEIGGRGALLISTLLMVYWKVPLLPLTLTVVIGNFTNFLISWYLSRGQLRLKWYIEKSYIMDVLRRTWPVAVSIWFSLLYFKADTIILSFFKSDYEVGIYGMPYRILETLITLPLLFMALLLPLCGKAYGQRNFAELKIYMQKGFDALSLMAVPLMFGALPLAKPIVLLLADDKFLPSAPLLQILMIGVAVIFIGALFGHAVISINKQRAMIKYYVVIAILMLALYFILIPVYSYWAAAWLTVAGEMLVFWATFWVVYKTTRFLPRMNVFLKSCLSAIIMAALLYPVRNLTLLFTLPFGAMIYVGVLYLTGGLKKELVREVFKL
jgi:O-antigen/teichoic acid export membrane protein